MRTCMDERSWRYACLTFVYANSLPRLKIAVHAQAVFADCKCMLDGLLLAGKCGSRAMPVLLSACNLMVLSLFYLIHHNRSLARSMSNAP